METLWQDEGCDDNPCDTEERLCRVFRRDAFLCATGFGKGEMQRIERRQAKGAGFRVSLGNERCGDRDGLDSAKVLRRLFPGRIAGKHILYQLSRHMKRGRLQ